MIPCSCKNDPKTRRIYRQQYCPPDSGELEQLRQKFVKVIPKDYKRVTEKVAQYLQSGMSEQEATIKVFEEVQA
ncbi:MAG: hypothetical protein ACLRXQ_07920 [Phascolarctobacterium faecium]